MVFIFPGYLTFNHEKRWSPYLNKSGQLSWPISAQCCTSLHSKSNAQLTFTRSKQTIETLETDVIYVESVSPVDLEQVNVSWAFDLLCSEMQMLAGWLVSIWNATLCTRRVVGCYGTQHANVKFDSCLKFQSLVSIWR